MIVDVITSACLLAGDRYQTGVSFGCNPHDLFGPRIPVPFQNDGIHAESPWPNDTGPYGTLQLIAEAIKFLQKEDIHPAQADRRVFRMAPVVVLASTFLLYVVLPAGPDAVVENLDTGVFYAMAVSSLSVLGILMAGWASANKYALLGGLRAAGQLIAYELPLILAVMGVVVQAESLNLQRIVEAQATGQIIGFGAIGNPFILTQFLAFLIFMIAAQAELTQTPFDMPVAETELVGGFHIEYLSLIHI